METNSEKMSAQQSLDLITEMIEKAKGNVKRNSFYFLLWGWTIVMANLGMFVLLHLPYEHPYVAWLITLPTWLYSMYRGYRQGQTEKTSTHLDNVTAWLWISFGIVIFTLVAFGYKINFQLNPVILLVSAIPTLVSGMMIRFRPLIIGGGVFWVLGIVCFLVPQDIQYLIGAFAITAGYLIPGYLLKNKHNL